MTPERGRYLGREGLMGLHTGEQYLVEVFMRIGGISKAPIICVSRAGDREYFIPYKSMKKLQQNWDFMCE